MKHAKHLSLDEYMPYLVNRLGVALVDWFAEHALGEHKLTIAMWRVLAILSDNDQLRLTDLSELTSIEPSTVSRIVTKLVSLGLVKRTRRATNSREVSVDLTAKGETITAALIPVARELERTATMGISDRELSIVRRVLAAMHENIIHPHDGQQRKNGRAANMFIGNVRPK